MKTIWKYPLSVTDTQTIPMPRCAELLTVQNQHDQPTLWARVEDENDIVPREILIAGTGNSTPDVEPYVGTFQLHGGALVFHVFDGGEK